VLVVHLERNTRYLCADSDNAGLNRTTKCGFFFDRAAAMGTTVNHRITHADVRTDNGAQRKETGHYNDRSESTDRRRRGRHAHDD
jgi:hypothetical protein